MRLFGCFVLLLFFPLDCYASGSVAAVWLFFVVLLVHLICWGILLARLKTYGWRNLVGQGVVGLLIAGLMNAPNYRDQKFLIDSLLILLSLMSVFFVFDRRK